MNQGARTTYCRYPYIKGVEQLYELTEKPLLFLDLGLIYPGVIIWEDRAGKAHPLHAGVEYYGEQRLPKDDVVARPFRVPRGVEIEAQLATKGPPVPATGVLLHDGGRYRMWYVGREPQGQVSLAARDTLRRDGYDLTHLGLVLRYIESDDGVEWRAPEFDRLLADGKPTNVVYGSLLAGRRGMAGGAVFIDPSAPPAQRYKMLFTGRLTPEEHAAHARKRGDGEVDTLAALTGHQVIFGAHSPDGIAWTALDDPVMLCMAEGAYTCHYDVERGAYRAYMRHWYTAQRRTIAVSETTDFSRFARPRPLLMPGLGDPLHVDYYTNAHTLYPGTSDVHLMFVAVYERGSTDCLSLRLATSVDGDVFSFVPGPPVIDADRVNWDPDAPAGEPLPPAPGAGAMASAAAPLAHPACIFPGDGMVPFGRDHVGIVYREDNVPHKWPRTVQWTHYYGWALWRKERLVALRAAADGEFTTSGMTLTKPVIFINASTEPDGRIACGLLDERGEPVAGFGLDESDPITGDRPHVPLTWRGGRTPPAEHVGRRIYLRFRMSRAKLFGLSAGEPE